jgi:hypothetical protein
MTGARGARCLSGASDAFSGIAATRRHGGHGGETFAFSVSLFYTVCGMIPSLAAWRRGNPASCIILDCFGLRPRKERSVIRVFARHEAIQQAHSKQITKHVTGNRAKQSGRVIFFVRLKTVYTARNSEAGFQRIWPKRAVRLKS